MLKTSDGLVQLAKFFIAEPQIIEGCHVVRIKAQGLTETFYRLGHHSLVSQHISKIGVRLPVSGIDAQYLAIAMLRFNEFAFIFQRVAQVVACFDVIGVDPQGLSKALHCLLDLSMAGLGDAFVVVGPHQNAVQRMPWRKDSAASSNRP